MRVSMSDLRFFSRLTMGSTRSCIRATPSVRLQLQGNGDVVKASPSLKAHFFDRFFLLKAGPIPIGTIHVARRPIYEAHILEGLPPSCVSKQSGNPTQEKIWK